MDKRDFLFRFVDVPTRGRLKFDEEAYYSTTDQLTANKIAKILLKVVEPDAVVTDATACVGGSTYAFARVFHRVNAIEIDKRRHEYLRHNMMMLGVADRVGCIHGDALDVCTSLRQDVIFLDPPWGGPEYKTQDRVNLWLSGLPLSEVCRRLAASARFIVIKVPINFDEDGFCTAIASFGGHIVLTEKNLRKMHLIVVEARAH